jgi:hypothetical protein
MEYELIDTGVFNDDWYFDVFVEYAKSDPEDMLIRISVHNRGAEAATLHVLPTLWFRNTWSWEANQPKPVLSEDGGRIHAFHPELGDYSLQPEGPAEVLFTENETNAHRLWGQPNPSPYVKDAIHEYLISGRQDAVNPAHTGTKAAVHYTLNVPAQGSAVVRLRLSAKSTADAFGSFDAIVAKRLREADDFYDCVIPESLGEDERRVYRQALAGMLWSKQYYYFDLDTWLDEHKAHPLIGTGLPGARNSDWFHMYNSDVISMPDKWEYPWYAAWDLAFHMVGLLPVCAATVFEPREGRFARLNELIALFRKRHPELLQQIAPADESFVGYGGRRLTSVCNKEKLVRVLSHMLDEEEFLSPHGIRSLSRYHAEHPFFFDVEGQQYGVHYLPAESDTGMFGGNSNWRGPVWMPVNVLLIRGLLNLYQFYGDDFRVECPTRSGNHLTLFEVAKEIARRLSTIFLRDANGQRPVYGGTTKFQDDPHWRDYILFYEYFHGDNGAGLGASHQTGWTGLVALSLDFFARVSQEEALKVPKAAVVRAARVASA